MPNDAITVEGGLFPAELLDDIAGPVSGNQPVNTCADN